MASIAIVSLLIPSILFFLFIYFFKFLMANMSASYTKPSNPNSDHHMLKYMALLLAVEVSLLTIYFIISEISNTEMTLVSAVSYTDKNFTSRDLFSSFKRTWKRSFSRRLFLVSSHKSSSSHNYLSIAFILASLLMAMYPNYTTILVAVFFGITVYILHLYSSVVGALSIVVSIVEDRSRMEAMEKAENLVQGGQHIHGFMLNLFFNLLGSIILLAFWTKLGNKGLYQNLTICGFFFLNFLSLFKMFSFVAYTVFYFQCKKHQGEEDDLHSPVLH